MMAAINSASARRGIIIGALMMVAATFCFTALDSILKILVARHNVGFLAFTRYLTQFLCMLALMPLVGTRAMLPRHAPFIHLMRGVALIGTTVLIVMALRVLPMAQTYAITFSAPLISVILAWIVLRERVSWQRFGLILMGFVGVLVALQPGSTQAGWALLLPLGMALANACFHVMTRAIAAGEEPLALVFSSCSVALGLTALALPWTYTTMNAADWGLITLGGVFGTLAHLLLGQAFRVAPTAVVSPMIYTQIISAGALGYLVFSEVPTLSTVLGSAIVAGSGIALVWLRR